jgi:hypothetical protein
VIELEDFEDASLWPHLPKALGFIQEAVSQRCFNAPLTGISTLF